jgi:hypothetical protein
MNRGSSRRLMLAPISFAVAMVAPLYLAAMVSAAYWMALTILW